MKHMLIIGSLVAVTGLLLVAGWVVWLVFGGGPDKLSADRALTKRTFSADTGLTVGEFLDVKVPRGFKSERRTDLIEEYRDPETLSFELTLGRYSAIGGHSDPAKMYLTVTSSGNEAKILPAGAKGWRSQGAREGLDLFDGSRSDSPGQVVVTAVDSQGGLRAELRTSNDVYTLEQALAIVCEVVRSMSIHRPAVEAVFAMARANLEMDTRNRTQAFELIATKLGPFPDEPGTARRLADGGFVMRDYKENISAHTAIVVGSQPVSGDPEKAAVELMLDPARITADLSNEVAYTNDSFALPNNALRVGVLALWLDDAGKLRMIDLQQATPPHWSRDDYNEPWRVALKACAQPGKLTFVRFASFSDFNQRKLADIGGWIDGSRQIGAWAATGNPLWIVRKAN